MCYMTVVSTTSENDLSELNSELVQFSRKIPEGTGQSFLRFPNKWYLGSKDGCSCGFRHLDGANVGPLGFADPVEWWPEDPEDIAATIQVIRGFKSLLAQGAKLDCVDTWCGNDPGAKLDGEMIVNLIEIPESSFRFFEGYRFDLRSLPDDSIGPKYMQP